MDTSVWVGVFRARDPIDLTRHVAVEEVVTCLPVIQEVLQGFRDERAFRLARESMLAFPIVDSPLQVEVFEQAAELHRAARRAGRTVRSSTDCLIAASALRHDVIVLHVDREFDALAEVSGLQQERLR